MSSELNNIISYNKSFTPKNIIYSKERKHYLNENEKSTDSTEPQYESKAILTTDKIIGNYSLIKKISKSSYTKVFQAKHIITGENVIIRIINKQLFKDDLLSMTRFNKELQIIKIINHPNIVKLLEIIETNTKIYLISEYLPYNLLSYIEKEKRLSENKARFFFLQLISSLNYLHLMGIAHRNINPENVLLDEKYTTIKITGFEVSTFYNKGSLLSSPVGTLLFAPPEMILSQKYKGELNDIWDAGIVLYAMVCGNLPFSQENQDVNINHIIEGFYDIPKDISINCGEIIKACLECNPEKRITFNKLKDLKWIKFNNFEYIKGININEGNIIVDEIILQECKKYISANNQDILNKIKKSVIENKFDEFSSLYYLVFQKQIKKGYKSSFNLNKKRRFYNFANLTKSNEENNLDKDDLCKYSSHTHTNSFSTYRLAKNKFDCFDTFNNRNTNTLNQKYYYQTLRSSKSNKKNIINISSMNFTNKNAILSPKMNNNVKNIHYHKKILNKLKLSESRVNKVGSTPKIYSKKTSFIIKPKFLYTKSKSNNKIEKKITKINFDSNEKIKLQDEYNSNNINNSININNDDQPLNTLFVNRVKNINNNYYYIQKGKNKSSEDFYINCKNKDSHYKAKTNLISINKKNLFINPNNSKCNKKNETNIDKILMDDQPAINFSMNFNNTLLNNYKKNPTNDINQNELTMNNYNILETENYIKQSLLKKKTNVRSYKRLDYFYETPKKIRETSNYFNYNYKNNIKTNNNQSIKLNTSNKANISISDSFNKFIQPRKLLRPSVLRNTINDQYYNTTVYQEEKTLNKIRSFGGLRITKKVKDNNFQKFFCQNTFSLKDRHNYYSNYFGTADKKLIKKKDNKKSENKALISRIAESSEYLNDLEVFDLSCIKYCFYEDLIEKICNNLKKNKIKYCFINKNKIHCSGKTGIFFDLEIKELNFGKKILNDNNNIDKNNNIGKNNKIKVQKLGNTYLDFKKIYRNKKNENKNIFYVNFYSKQNDFKKNNSKLIYDILY